MKKSLLLGFCSLLAFSPLVACNNNQNPNSAEVHKKSNVTLIQSDGGKMSFVRPDDYEYKIGDICPLDIEPIEGYRILYVKVNDKKIRPDEGDYTFVINDENVIVKAVFEKISLDMRDFEFKLDKSNMTASITNYVPMGGLVPTPFIIPETYTDPSDGSIYKITSIGSRVVEDDGQIFRHPSLENSQISKIHLSKNIEILEDGALNSILTLREITVDEENPYFKAVDGVLYNKDLTQLVSVPYFVRGVYRVKDSVTSIAPYAFRNNGFITEIEMGDQVTKIGNNAFQKMRDLQSAKLSKNIEEIPDFAFDYCSELSEVNIPTSAKRIGIRAFNFCNNIYEVKIPTSVKTIEREAFFHVKYLSTLTFEEGVESIGFFAFGQCDEFETLNLPKSLKIIEAYAFDECRSLRKVTFAEGLEEIGDSAFQLCTSIAKVNLPASLKILGNNPFLGCGECQITIDPKNVSFKVIDGIVFTIDETELIIFPYLYLKGQEDKDNGYKYHIPESVTILRNRSFAFNIELKEVYIHKNVEIMDNAFYNLLPEDNLPGNYKLKLIYEGTKDDFRTKFLGVNPFNNKAFFLDDLVHCEDGSIVLEPFDDPNEEPNKQDEGIL